MTAHIKLWYDRTRTPLNFICCDSYNTRGRPRATSKLIVRKNSKSKMDANIFDELDEEDLLSIAAILQIIENGIPVYMYIQIHV